MLSSEVFVMPYTFASGLGLTRSSAPSRAFTTSVEPSTFSIVPRTRVGTCAKTNETNAMAKVAANAARTAFFIFPPECVNEIEQGLEYRIPVAEKLFRFQNFVRWESSVTTTRAGRGRAGAALPAKRRHHKDCRCRRRGR